MKTYTTLRNTTAAFCNLSTSDTVKMALVDQNINDSIRTISNINSGKWRWLEGLKEIQTVASQRGYQVQNGFRKIMDVFVTLQDSQTIYMPEMIFDPAKWKLILAARLGTSDTPYFCYVQGNTIQFAPIPASDGNVITIRGRLQNKDLSIADYTTGSIVSVPYTTTFTGAVAADAVSATLSGAWGLTTGTYQVIFSSGEIRDVTLTNGATTATWTNGLGESATSAITVGTDTGGSIVTGTGTTFTADMVGRFIKITETTAANGGDGYWYEIGSYYSSTIIGLLKRYEGTAIASATAAYTIGQTSLIPEAYDIAVCYRAAALYWQNQNDLVRAKTYWMQYDGGMEAGLGKDYGGIMLQMFQNESETEEGAYIPPFGTGFNLIQAPYYYPYQDASGFN